MLVAAEFLGGGCDLRERVSTRRGEAGAQSEESPLQGFDRMT